MKRGDIKRVVETCVEIEFPGSGLGAGGVEQIDRSVVNGDGGHTARVSGVQGREFELHDESIADSQVRKL